MIPIYQPYFTEKNLSYAHDAINSGWVSSQGEYLDSSKNKLKNILGYQRVILTNNGTSATHLMAIALRYKHPNIKKIIVPSNVYVAAWNAFLYEDYELIPIDSDIDTWNFDISKLDSIIDDDSAILVVHNIGNVVNVPELKIKFPNTVILEDNCEGFLGKYNDKYTGTESFASSISFFGNKTITSGEGGAFVTDDDDVFEYINKVKSQGQTNEKFIHDVLGYNYRMTNIQAAILYGQLECLSEIQAKKHNIFELYKSLLQKLTTVSFQKVEKNTKHSEWMLGIRLNQFNLSQKQNLQLYLFEAGIETRTMFYDITKHKHIMCSKSKNLNSDLLNNQCIILPSYPSLTDGQIEHITNKIKEYLK
jgi:perosamine synthetase